MKPQARIGFLLLFAVIGCSTAHATHALGEQVSIGLGQSADFDGTVAGVQHDQVVHAGPFENGPNQVEPRFVEGRIAPLGRGHGAEVVKAVDDRRARG